MIVFLAQNTKAIGGGIEGVGPFGFEGLGQFFGVPAAGQFGQVYALSLFNKVISNAIGVMTIIAGLWFIFNFIIGAYGYLSAGGNEDGVKKATAKIGQSLTGLVIVIAAYAIISIIGAVLGFDILNPQDIILKLKP